MLQGMGVDRQNTDLGVILDICVYIIQSSQLHVKSHNMIRAFATDGYHRRDVKRVGGSGGEGRYEAIICSTE